MHTCPKCEHELTLGEMSARKCKHCGTELPHDMAIISMMESANQSMKPDSVEVPVYTEEDAKASMNPVAAPGTVGSVDWSKLSGMTSEANLPEPLQSIIDPDRTVGLNDEEMPPMGADKTVAEQTLLSQDPEVSEAEVAGVSAEAASEAGSQKSESANSGSAGTGRSAGGALVSRARESHLVIQQRLLVPESEQDSDLPNRADYKILGELGKGGMGQVWRARQLSLNREVAVKQIRSDSLKGKSVRKVESARQSFLAEAVITGDLNHPNIVPIYDLGSDNEGNLLYSMKCVSGTSWDRLIESLSETENLEILRKVADAIAFAHDRGVVHRDLKPANIMVGRFGEVLVMDWGTAMPLTHFTGTVSKGSVSGRAGTPAYMPPEQAEGELSKIGVSSDVYLLGAILFEIVAGCPPHPLRSTTGGSLSTKELLDNAFANRIVHTDASGELVEIALKAMRTAPRDRYPNVEKFIEALKSYQQHAESVVLANQARKDLEAANQSKDFSMYARSLYGFENALSLWDANYDASAGLIDARLNYADAALKGENYDLGLSLVNFDSPVYKGTQKKLLAGKEERDKRVGRLKTAKRTVQALAVILLVGGTVAGLWIASQNVQLQASLSSEQKAKQAALDSQKMEEIAKNDAKKSEAAALIARDLAETNEKEAKRQETIARDLADKNIKLAASETKAKEEAVDLAKKNEMLAISEGQAKDLAVKAKDEAVAQREKAVAAQKAEEIAKKDAIAAKNEAVAAKEKEIAAKNKVLEQFVASEIALAGQYIDQNAFDSARAELARIDQLREELEKANSEAGKEGQQSSALNQLGYEYKRLKYLTSLGDDKLNAGQKTSGVALTATTAGPHLLATANLRGEIEVYEAGGQRTPIKTFNLASTPSAIALSPDENFLVVGDTSGAISQINLKSGAIESFKKPAGKSDSQSAITRLLYLPEGPTLVSTSDDHVVRLWNSVGAEPLELKGHTDAVLSVARVANRANATIGIVTGDTNRGEIRFWKIAKDEKPISVPISRKIPAGVTSLAVQEDRGNDNNFTIFAGLEDGSLNAYDITVDAKTGLPGKTEELKEFKLNREPADRHRAAVTQLIIDPNKPDRLISASKDNTLRVWNINPATVRDAKGKQSLLVQTLRGHGNAVLDAVAWIDAKTKATRLLSVSADGSARMWNPDTYAEVIQLGGRNLHRESGAYGEVLSVSVGGDQGGRVMGISRDGVATIWTVGSDAANGSQPQPIALREGHRFLTQSATFLKDSLATVSFDGTGVVWSTLTGSMIERWNDVGTSGILAGSADGRFVVLGYSPPKGTNEKQNIQVVKLHGAAQDSRKTFAAGSTIAINSVKTDDQPSCVAISGDGKWSVVGTENGFLNLIDLENQTLQPAVSAHEGSDKEEDQIPEGVTGVAFVLDSTIASVGLDGILKFWSHENGQVKPHATLQQVPLKDTGATHRALGLVASADGKRLAIRVRQVVGRGAPRNADFRQIWIADVTPQGATILADRLQPWDSTSKDGSQITSMSLTPNGDRLLATVGLVGNQAKAQKKATVLREWNLADLKSPPKDVLYSDATFEFQQAMYLPGQADEIAILADTLTSVRKRNSEGNFQTATIASYGPTVALQACDVSHDGSLAVTISDDLIPSTDEAGRKTKAKLGGEVRIWKVTNSVGERIGSLKLPDAVRSISINPKDSNLILVSGNLKTDGKGQDYCAELYRWNGKTFDKLQSLGHHEKWISRSRFSADGHKIVTASVNGQVQIFESNEGKYELAKSFDLKTDNPKLALDGLITADLSDDGKLLLVADRNGALVLDVQSGEPIIDQLIQGHSNDLTDVRFATRPSDMADAPIRIWTASLDGNVKFWGLGAAEEKDGHQIRPVNWLLKLSGHQQGVLGLAALPNGGVVTAGKDGQVILWPIAETTN